ncbi:MAG: SelT/SelW/SelH family protein [Planctomycetes bacterium]|nr:SelT/SelW/SelH family protein [Planctomycetota bacterium]
MKKEFGVEAKLIKGSGGVFEITVNGELIYSKKATGKFPEPEEIFYHVRQAAGAGAAK